MSSRRVTKKSKSKLQSVRPRSRSPKRQVKKKNLKITRATYSPKWVTEWYTVDNGRKFEIQVVRDDLLIGGTKQRGLVPLLQAMPQTEFVMPAANDGLGQVALAHSAALIGRSATVVVASRAKESRATTLARSLGAKIIAVKPGYMTVRKARARTYAEQQNRKSPGSTQLFELGVNEPEYEKHLLKELRLSLPKNFQPPKRLWIAVGSGLLMRVFGQLWPETMLLGVQVGMRQSAVDILGKERAKKAKIFIEDQLKFESPTKNLPPWPAMPTYDAKLWRWIMEYGRQGDLVWNVGIDKRDE